MTAAVPALDRAPITVGRHLDLERPSEQLDHPDP